jgi:nitroimidazol reductase NimA-like FMN-containing flavoprotein (pyridoxamine 5'-phosphate oxidase superfamily)
MSNGPCGQVPSMTTGRGQGPSVPPGGPFGPDGSPVASSTLVTMLIEDGLELLTDEDCWQLLRSAHVGRVGVTMAALPAIFPVNYAVIDDTIMFRTSAGSKLAAAARQAIVAFEVDDYDQADRSGWSVLAVGPSEIVHDLDVTAKVLAAGLEPWADGRRTDLVRITPGFLSGRRIVHPALNSIGHNPLGGADDPSQPPNQKR